MTFSHLHVASGYSLQYGTATPQAIADRAAELGQSIVGLTDRDGLYGAVRWMLACRSAGIGPVLGVDLAMEETSPVTGTGTGGALRGAESPRRSPAHGGTWLDEDRPRVLLLAADARGWASLCRLVSAAHTGAHTERGRPWLTWAALREHSEGVVALLTADSEVGRLFTSQRVHRAAGAVRPWRAIFGPRLGIAVASHRTPARHRHATATAAAMLGWARQRAAAGGAHQRGALPAPGGRPGGRRARLRAPAGAARLPAHRPDNGEGFLKDAGRWRRSPTRSRVAAGERDGRRLLADTQRLAEHCALTPADLGIGEVFVPELDVLLRRAGPARPEADERADALLRERCRRRSTCATRARPTSARRSARLEDELRTITHLRFSGYFLTVAEVVELIRRAGCGSPPAGRAPAAWSTTCSASPGSTRSGTAC